MPRESAIVNAIMRWLKNLPNCEARKAHGSVWSVAGDPDIYGCINGRMFLLEVKQPGRRPTVLQEKRLREWRGAGAIVGVAHSLEEAQTIVEPLLRMEKQ